MSAYAIKLTSANDLEVCGTPLPSRVITLNPGWHYLPVLSECPVNTMGFFGSVLNSIVIVQEIAGSKVFWPAVQVYSLNELLPGKGYAIKVSNQVTLTYPACTKTNQWESVATINHFISPWNEFNSASEKQVLVIFGDDPTTPQKDGFSENETLEFRLWNAETNEEFTLDVSLDQTMPNSELVFLSNGLSKIESMNLLATCIHESGNNLNVQIIPNPAKDEFVLIMSSENFIEAKLTIFKVDGQQISTHNLLQTKTKINVSELSPGIYILNINIDGKPFNKRLVKN
jgi:hypothetical protein